MDTCAFPGCTATRYTHNGRTYTRCEAHQKEAWRSYAAGKPTTQPKRAPRPSPTEPHACKTCGVVKPVEDFALAGSDGHRRRVCKTCWSKQVAAGRAAKTGKTPKARAKRLPATASSGQSVKLLLVAGDHTAIFAGELVTLADALRSTTLPQLIGFYTHLGYEVVEVKEGQS